MSGPPGPTPGPTPGTTPAPTTGDVPAGGGEPGTAGAAPGSARWWRRPSLAAWLVIGGVVAIALLVIVPRLATADPYDTVLDAAAESLTTPFAADVTAEVDLGRLGELAPAGDGDGGASLALGLLSGRATLDGRVTIDRATALVELTSRGGGLASLRLDEGEVPLARLDADLVGQLPGGPLLRRAVPGVLGDGWVALGTEGRFAPSPRVVTDRLDRLRLAAGEGDRDRIRDDWTITRVGRDGDGERFRAVPAGAAEANEDDTAAGIDVWVERERVSRIRFDALPFLRTELFGVALRGGEGGLALDLRPTTGQVPPRPEPGGLLDAEALRSLLPF